MQPNFLATPTKFGILRDGRVATFFESIEDGREQFLNGSVVTSPDAPGSVAYVAAANGMADGKPSQRILMSLHSPKLPVLSGTLEFTSTDDPEAEFVGALAGLALNILPMLLGSQQDSKELTAENAQLIPILVGPSSVSQGPIDDPEGLVALGGIFDIMSDIARTVVPAIAPVALDVAQQLLTKTKNPDPEEVMFDFGGLVGDIVKVAAPVAGAALTELGKRF